MMRLIWVIAVMLALSASILAADKPTGKAKPMSEADIQRARNLKASGIRSIR